MPLWDCAAYPSVFFQLQVEVGCLCMQAHNFSLLPSSDITKFYTYILSQKCDQYDALLVGTARGSRGHLNPTQTKLCYIPFGMVIAYKISYSDLSSRCICIQWRYWKRCSNLNSKICVKNGKYNSLVVDCMKCSNKITIKKYIQSTSKVEWIILWRVMLKFEYSNSNELII